MCCLWATGGQQSFLLGLTSWPFSFDISGYGFRGDIRHVVPVDITGRRHNMLETPCLHGGAVKTETNS